MWPEYETLHQLLIIYTYSFLLIDIRTCDPTKENCYICIDMDSHAHVWMLGDIVNVRSVLRLRSEQKSDVLLLL